MTDAEGPQDVPPNPPPPGGQYPPNWGSAYPPQPGQYPPQAGQYPPPPGQYPPPPGYYPQRPKHPQAVTAMVLGIVGISGFMFCLTFFAAPFAWWLGSKSVREIDASGGAYDGRGEASAGKIMGIIGTILLILVLAVAILLIVLTFTIDNFWNDSGTSDGYYDNTSLVGLF